MKSLTDKTRKLEKKIIQQKNLLQKYFNYRLISGLGTGVSFLLASLFRETIVWQILCFITGPVFFIYYYKKSKLLQKYIDKIQQLNHFYKKQLQRKKGFSTNQEGIDSNNIPASNIATDLDIFNQHSLFDLLNETFSPGGQQFLANQLANPSTDIKEIKKRHNYIKEFTPFHWKFVRLILLGSNSTKLSNSISQLGHLLNKSITDKTFKRNYTIQKTLFLLTFLAFFLGFPFSIIPKSFFALSLSLQFGFSLFAASQIKEVFGKANDIGLNLHQLYPALGYIEDNFRNTPVSKVVKNILSNKPSKQIKKINFIISGLSVQGNPLVFLILNGFIPWSYFFSNQLEKLRLQLSNSLPETLNELYHLEFLISLSIFHHYQTNTLPTVTDEKKLAFDDLFHPLIPREQTVKNSFSLNNAPHLNLITGSNMAGKSTFLRTLGVNHILFLIGAPVFAKHYSSFPFKLLTCIKVEDSLDDGFSYFYAEVKRLAEIKSEIEENTPCLYLVDEIFKGTNNRERIIGSRSIMQKLTGYNSLGFVTTHDLELTELADNSSLISNYHFKDDVSNQKLVFDYKICSGPCPTTNALKIMIQTGLFVPENSE